MFAMVGPNRDFESDDAAAADEGAGAFAPGFALDEEAADDVALAVTTSDGLRCSLHAIAIRSRTAKNAIMVNRNLPAPDLRSAIA